MERGFPLSKALYEQLEFPFVHWKLVTVRHESVELEKCLSLNLQTLWGNVSHCHFYSYLGNFLSSLNPACGLVYSQWLVFVQTKGVYYPGEWKMLEIRLYRPLKSNFCPTYCNAQTQSNITHFLCCIASSKHGWEPIRVLVTWFLFCKWTCLTHLERTEKWIVFTMTLSATTNYSSSFVDQVTETD